MSSYVSAELRRLVRSRAEGVCEYCLIHEDDTGYGCEIDHVISEKHREETTAANLAFACWPCNNSKGTDIGSIDQNRNFVRLFNPRTDHWADHFVLADGELAPLTSIGEATARILGFNHPDHIQERHLLVGRGRYPSDAALRRMRR